MDFVMCHLNGQLHHRVRPKTRLLQIGPAKSGHLDDVEVKAVVTLLVPPLGILHPLPYLIIQPECQLFHAKATGTKPEIYRETFKMTNVPFFFRSDLISVGRIASASAELLRVGKKGFRKDANKMYLVFGGKCMGLLMTSLQTSWTYLVTATPSPQECSKLKPV